MNDDSSFNILPAILYDLDNAAPLNIPNEGLSNVPSCTSTNQEVPLLTDTQDLESLLNSWNLITLLPVLQNSGITYRSLQYLSKDDIKDAISDIGLRAEFREKLFYWRKHEYGIDDETITFVSTFANKVNNWLQNTSSQKDVSHESSPSSTKTTSKISKGLFDILNESHKGKCVLEYYKQNFTLDKTHRDNLVSIILEDVHYNGQCLAPKDYPSILKEIELVFPKEREFLDYYFFSRKRKKNPGGRLYNKYINSTNKIRRCKTSSVSRTSSVDSTQQYSQEFDKDILVSLKTSLQREFSDWAEVKDKWQKSFPLRMTELKSDKSKTITEFLKEWPLLTHSKAKDLINIDFDLLLPNKKNLLYSKWEQFKKQIKGFYSKSINDKISKELFLSLTNTTETNAEDFILTILLNAIILPTGRFANEKGSNKRKATIKDAQESFTLRIPTINDFDRGVAELKSRYFNIGVTLQPFIIVVGVSPGQITDFFVYFDNCRQRHDSYLSCVDTCFKIFYVLNLEYPQASSGPWFFIQKYFFEIVTEFDKPSPNITSLVAFLNREMSV